MFGAAREKDRVLEVAAEVDHEMFRCTVLADRRLEDTQRVHPAGILPQDLHSEDVPGVLIDDLSSSASALWRRPTTDPIQLFNADPPPALKCASQRRDIDPPGSGAGAQGLAVDVRAWPTCCR